MTASKQGGKAVQRKASKTSSTGAASRRGSKTTKSTAEDLANKTSPEPTTAEGRLSLTATTAISNRGSGKKVSVKGGGSGPHMAPLVGPRIADLVRSIDPNYGIEPDAEEQVLQLADDFLDKVTKQAIRLAQHRGSKTLEVRDLQIVLAKNFGIVVPGLGMPPARSINRSSVTSKTSATASGSNSKSSSSSTSGPGSATKRNSTTSISGETTNSARKKANIGSQEGAVSGGASASII